MKARKVSALRKRGLRCVCSAEPQVRLPMTSNQKRKADTMKTYILRPHNTVELQKAQFVKSLEPIVSGGMKVEENWRSEIPFSSRPFSSNPSC